MVVVVLRENTFNLEGKPEVEIIDVFHGFKDEDEAMHWIERVKTGRKDLVWSIIDSLDKSVITPQHSVNPDTDRCVMCGRNRWNRERTPWCDSEGGHQSSI